LESKRSNCAPSRKWEDSMTLVRSTLTLAVAVALVTLAASVSPTAAAPRAPQVAFCEGSLQSYLNGVGESINVLTDQVDAQVWTTGVSGNADLTIMVELAGYATLNNIGIYNTAEAVPTLFQVFPGAASAGWSAYLHFGGGNLGVSLFNNGAYQGTTNYSGVNATQFGFYLQGPGGTFYSQDWLNGNNAQVLTYLGTGINSGDKWVCFEDLPYQYPNCNSDFEDAVLVVQSLNPVPVNARTWGAVKALYGR
jgi:hypothetical protein